VIIISIYKFVIESTLQLTLEDLVPNALIELIENNVSRSVSYPTILEYGNVVVNELKKQHNELYLRVKCLDDIISNMKRTYDYDKYSYISKKIITRSIIIEIIVALLLFIPLNISGIFYTINKFGLLLISLIPSIIVSFADLIINNKKNEEKYGSMFDKKSSSIDRMDEINNKEKEMTKISNESSKIYAKLTEEKEYLKSIKKLIDLKSNEINTIIKDTIKLLYPSNDIEGEQKLLLK
jgi:hypothetical protein